MLNAAESLHLGRLLPAPADQDLHSGARPDPLKMEARRLGLVEDVALVVSELYGVAGKTGLGSLVLLGSSYCHG
jgi:hypothetical protein